MGLPVLVNSTGTEAHTAEIDMVTILESRNTLTCFYLLLNAAFGDGDTPNMIQDYLNPKPEKNIKEIKKLAESGDWKAALILV
jgi:hypothetical protein